MPKRQEIGRKKFDRDVQTIRTKFPQWVYLDSPLTSTDWDGDSFSTTAKTLVDIHADFGVPAGVRAVLLRVIVRDSASAANDCYLIISPNNNANEGFRVRCSGRPNDYWEDQCLTVPCTATGKFYYQIVASGAGTLDAYIQVWGYAI